MALASSRVCWRRRRCLQVLPLLMPLLGCSGGLANPRLAIFTLQCRVEAAELLRLRIDPRRQQIELLDPRSGEVMRTITTSQPPPELGPGIIDDSTVTISDREIVWEQRMYRPQYVRERHRIDRVTLAYRFEEAFQIEMGPEMAEQTRRGTCQPVEAAGAGASTAR